MDGENLLLDYVTIKHPRGHWFHTMVCYLADKRGMPVNDYLRYLVIREYDKELNNEDFSNKRIQR